MRNASVICCAIHSAVGCAIATGLGRNANGKVVRPGSPGKLEKIDRKQNRMEEEYGIKVSRYTVEAEEHIADDRENTQRHDGAHAEAGKDGKSCGVSDNIDI